MEGLKEKIGQVVEQKLAGTDLFLVEVKAGPGKIWVTIDKPAGITISECTDLARYLQEDLKDAGIFEKHELEVSSPGMEEPLKVMKQYNKRIGREVRVLKRNGMVTNGILKAASNEGVELEERIEKKINKKKTVEVNNVRIPFEDIKETTVVFKFN